MFTVALDVGTIDELADGVIELDIVFIGVSDISDGITEDCGVSTEFDNISVDDEYIKKDDIRDDGCVDIMDDGSIAPIDDGPIDNIDDGSIAPIDDVPIGIIDEGELADSTGPRVKELWNLLT